MSESSVSAVTEDAVSTSEIPDISSKEEPNLPIDELASDDSAIIAEEETGEEAAKMDEIPQQTESTIVPTASSSASTPPSGSSSNNAAKTFFADTNLTVYDWTTPAVSVQSSQETGMSFVDTKGNKLGNVSSGKVNYADSGYSFDLQGAIDAFNDYRGVSRQALKQGISSGNSNSSDNANTSSNSSQSSQIETKTVDTAAYAQEVIRLVNAERVAVGFNELEIDSAMMSVAATRAKELETKYSHERPDGTRISLEYSYGEILNRKTSTPNGAVSSWMGSDGHKELILAERYNSVGAACYQDKDGALYWVMVFSR